MIYKFMLNCPRNYRKVVNNTYKRTPPAHHQQGDIELPPADKRRIRKVSSGSFTVEVVIQNKPAARDPEGETILRDLIHRGGYSIVKGIRTGKYLNFHVEAESENAAKDKVFAICNALRIFNPVVHTCRIESRASLQ